MISGLLALISATLLGVQITLGTNTLFHSNTWKVEKREMILGLTGSDEYLSTRAPLFGNVLNLGNWYGFQSVQSPELKEIISGKLRFKLEENQELSIKINDKSYTDVGVALSSNSSNLFWGKNLINRKDIGFNSPKGWNEFDFSRVERKWSFKVNGKVIAEHLINGPFSFTSLTLQSGAKGSKVDDVVLESENESFYDGFFDTYKALGLAFFWLLALVAIKMSLMAFIPEIDTRIVQLIFLGLIVCQSIYYVSDRFVLSKHEVSPFSKTLAGRTVTSFPNAIEKFRWGFFHLLALNSPGNIPSSKVLAERGYPVERIWEGPITCSGKKCMKRRLETATQIVSRAQSKMVLIGTSQSVGAGASSLNKTFFARLHGRLQTKLIGSRLVSINLSESGSNPQLLFEKYGKTLERLSPEIFVINLVNNGDDLNYFKGLENFLRIAKKKSAQIFLIQEAIDSESGKHLDKRREFLTKLQNEKTHVLDLNSFMNSNRQFAGDFRFWDFVHFNDQGHKMAGEWMADQIIKIMSRK